MNIQCFLIEPTGRTNLFLRRFRSVHENDAHPCLGGTFTYHNAMTPIGQAAEKKSPQGYVESVDPDIYRDDPRWPKKCERCDYAFQDGDKDDQWQVFQDSVYRRVDTGEEKGLREWQQVPGAMWDAWWWPSHLPDGKSPVVTLPGGHEWMIDSRASNCDSPCKHCGKPYHLHIKRSPGHEKNDADCTNYEDAKPHQCWVRQGEMPNLTVGKAGPTCGAGAGSILVPGWHGFLTGGVLIPC